MKKKKQHQNKHIQNDLRAHSSTNMKPKLTAITTKLTKSKTKVYIQKSLAKNPWCAHGPTILFERVCTENESKKSSKFYACSAYRDRKECGAFFQAADDAKCTVSKEKLLRWKRVLDHDSNVCRPQDPKTSQKDNEFYLPTLNRLLVSKHNSTKEAQYHFSKDTLEVLLNQFILHGNKKIRVVCVGTPKIHESIIALKLKGTSTNVKSILLDIDVRLRPIYDSHTPTWGTFCHYNMFNHFFFRETERQDYLNFLKGNEDVLIVTDPPFGGKCELIGSTLHAIKSDIFKLRNIETNVNFMWIFPYYMERQIQEAIPGIKMSDYQVCYETKVKNGYKDGLESGNSGCRKV